MESKDKTKLKEKSLSEVEPDIKINYFSLKQSCEELLDANLFSGVEPDISFEFVPLTPFCKKFNKDNILFKLEPNFVQTPCEDLLVIKLEDQKFRQLHEVQTLKTQK